MLRCVFGLDIACRGATLHLRDMSKVKNLVAVRRVRDEHGAYVVNVPLLVRERLDLKRGDYIEWICPVGRGGVRVRKVVTSDGG